MTEPQTLSDAIRYFSDQEVALKTMVELRWPDGVHCPRCGSLKVGYIATRRMWECKEKHAKKQFSAKVGTIFEDSALGLDKWFTAIWMIANMKNGVSSYELHRAIGVTQKSAWFMLHRIRLAMKAGSFDKFDGTVEADETFIGGLAKNMHANKRKKIAPGAVGKAIVMGVLERGGEKSASRVRAKMIPSTRIEPMAKVIRETVAPGATLMTDEAAGYKEMRREFKHQFVNHTLEYVRGAVHTNGIENFWSLLKRSLKGTYISVDPAHLQAYCDEQAFRFNERLDSDGMRFRTVAGAVSGKRLTYKELIGYDEAALPA
jgi:transposase-like protein